jgi:hypothetical protein
MTNQITTAVDALGPCGNCGLRASLRHSSIEQRMCEGWNRRATIPGSDGRDVEVETPWCCSKRCSRLAALRARHEASSGRHGPTQAETRDAVTRVVENAAPPRPAHVPDGWAERRENERGHFALQAAQRAARVADRQAQRPPPPQAPDHSTTTQVALPGLPVPIRCAGCRQQSSLCRDARLLAHPNVEVRAKAAAALADEGYVEKPEGSGRYFCGSTCARRAAASQGRPVPGADGVLTSAKSPGAVPVVTSADIAIRRERETAAREANRSSATAGARAALAAETAVASSVVEPNAAPEPPPARPSRRSR